MQKNRPLPPLWRQGRRPCCPADHAAVPPPEYVAPWPSATTRTSPTCSSPNSPFLPASSLPIWRPPASNRCRRGCQTRRRRSGHPRADRSLQGAPPRAPLPPRRWWRAGEPPSRRIFRRSIFRSGRRPLHRIGHRRTRRASSASSAPSLVSSAPACASPASSSLLSACLTAGGRRRTTPASSPCPGLVPALGQPGGRPVRAVARPRSQPGPASGLGVSGRCPAFRPAWPTWRPARQFLLFFLLLWKFKRN